MLPSRGVRFTSVGCSRQVHMLHSLSHVVKYFRISMVSYFVLFALVFKLISQIYCGLPEGAPKSMKIFLSPFKSGVNLPISGGGV